jgi:hypothetical protein
VTRQLLVTRSRRDVICILTYWRTERDGLFSKLEALNEPFGWDDVIEEDRTVEARTWAVLAQNAAAREGLTLSS